MKDNSIDELTLKLGECTRWRAEHRLPYVRRSPETVSQRWWGMIIDAEAGMVDKGQTSEGATGACGLYLDLMYAFKYMYV